MGVGEESKPAANVNRVPEESTMTLELVLNRKLEDVPGVMVMDVNPTGLGPEHVPEGVSVYPVRHTLHTEPP